MLNRLLLTWLMMTIFGYGMALAVDVHSDQSSEHSHSMEFQYAGDQSSHSDHDDAPKHDHCYHGSSHLLGLNSALHVDFTLQLSNGISVYSESVASSPHTRLLRPPKNT